MELSACIVVYNGAQEAIKAAQTVLNCMRENLICDLADHFS